MKLQPLVVRAFAGEMRPNYYSVKIKKKKPFVSPKPTRHTCYVLELDKAEAPGVPRVLVLHERNVRQRAKIPKMISSNRAVGGAGNH